MQPVYVPFNQLSVSILIVNFCYLDQLSGIALMHLSSRKPGEITLQSHKRVMQRVTVSVGLRSNVMWKHFDICTTSSLGYP